MVEDRIPVLDMVPPLVLLAPLLCLGRDILNLGVRLLHHVVIHEIAVVKGVVLLSGRLGAQNGRQRERNGGPLEAALCPAITDIPRQAASETADAIFKKDDLPPEPLGRRLSNMRFF